MSCWAIEPQEVGVAGLTGAAADLRELAVGLPIKI